MPYITSIERMGRQEGLEQGRQEGLEQGLEQGRQEGLEQGQRIALRTENGHYLCAENGGGQELIANRTGVGPWETFTIVHADLSSGAYALAWAWVSYDDTAIPAIADEQRTQSPTETKIRAKTRIPCPSRKICPVG